MQLVAAEVFGLAVSGDRPKKAAKFLTRGCSLSASAPNLRMVMSSIMRRRSGLMGASVMGAPV